MPEFIVSQTAIEYAAYNKKKQRGQMRTTLIAIVAGLISCGFLYWALWSLVVQ